MPRVAVPVTQITRAGVTLPAATAGDSTNNHSVHNDGRVALIAANTGASSRTLTFHTTQSVDGLTPAARQETLPAGEEQYYGPFDPTVYGTTLQVDVTSSEVTLRAIRL